MHDRTSKFAILLADFGMTVAAVKLLGGGWLLALGLGAASAGFVGVLLWRGR